MRFVASGRGRCADCHDREVAASARAGTLRNSESVSPARFGSEWRKWLTGSTVSSFGIDTTSRRRADVYFWLGGHDNSPLTGRLP